MLQNTVHMTPQCVQVRNYHDLNDVGFFLIKHFVRVTFTLQVIKDMKKLT